ncbi:hypothetical protein SDC9_186346 [bioreactor metagenome]|uniref:Uncharacterized protein n=1 Tax=bioreactor metagenome TaxID=1076179 RepID=A0A645HII3_9ZZZZ
MNEWVALNAICLIDSTALLAPGKPKKFTDIPLGIVNVLLFANTAPAGIANVTVE